MTRLGIVTSKDFMKPLKPCRGQKLEAESYVPISDYYRQAGERGTVLGDRLRGAAGEAVGKFFL